jgi:hypothetical protein
MNKEKDASHDYFDAFKQVYGSSFDERNAECISFRNPDVSYDVLPQPQMPQHSVVGVRATSQRTRHSITISLVRPTTIVCDNQVRNLFSQEYGWVSDITAIPVICTLLRQFVECAGEGVVCEYLAAYFAYDIAKHVRDNLAAHFYMNAINVRDGVMSICIARNCIVLSSNALMMPFMEREWPISNEQCMRFAIILKQFVNANIITLREEMQKTVGRAQQRADEAQSALDHRSKQMKVIIEIENEK